ncbi:RND family efflux transporter MFP subunit [Kushneria sinocarnis]|uniref:RND family efflux transporter MFP subunit n=1 Tax=Kushneria sinocarnis TaxID=595502 RepID=A0A420WWS1_9GAMM|nr:HlyD family secretion protein [Kushneria sinocarnis]RKR04192.1 RND family efflux transporter MFP subunit [Kushneria sinocarnis]
MRTFLKVLITLVMVALATALGLWLWHYYMYTPWTRDARVRADVITIAPDVSGWVSQMDIQDGQDVHKGDVLFRINDRRYQAALDQAKATVSQRQAEYRLQAHDYQRRRGLSSNAISSESLDTAQLNAQSAKASYEQAQAQLESAQIDLERTVIRAPTDGTVVNLNLREGNYVSQGNAQMSLIRAGSFYVTAYFAETKLPPIDVGDRASIHLMSGAKELTGHVASIGRGIANTNTTGNNQLLPQVQQTFTWVRLSQRIPVDIVIDHIPDGVYLSAGMTATVRIAPEDRDDSNRDTPPEAIQHNSSEQGAAPRIEGATGAGSAPPGQSQ